MCSGFILIRRQCCAARRNVYAEVGVIGARNLQNVAIDVAIRRFRHSVRHQKWR
jgi:hypothetical protein